MTAQELEIVRAVLVENKVVEPTATVGEITSAHEAILKSAQAPEYQAQLVAKGMPQPQTNWLTWLGLAAGVVGLYYVWRSFQTKTVSVREYDDDDGEDRRDGVRALGRAFGKLNSRMGGVRFGRARLGSHTKCGTKEPYEFEPELRLEGYRRRRRSARK